MTGQARRVRWALGACAFSALLFFWTGQSDAYGSPRLAVVALSAVAAWLAAWPRGGRRATPLDLPLLGFFAAFMASLLAASDPYVAIVGVYGIHAYGLVTLLLCVSVYLVTAWSAEPDNPDRLLAWTLGLAVLSASYGLLQKIGIEPFSGVRALGTGRIGGTQGDPVQFGACLLLFVPIALHFSRDAAWQRRALGRVGGLLIAAALALTVSRGAWLGAAAGACVYLWLSGRYPASRRGVLLVAGAAVLAVTAVAALRGTAKVSDSARVALWVSVARAVPQHPWLGEGPDSVQTILRRSRSEDFIRALGPKGSQVSAHNDVLQIAATMGLLGLAAYLWLLAGVWSALRNALRDERLRSAAAAVAGAVSGLFVQAKFNPVPLGALVLLALLLGLSARGKVHEGTQRAVRGLGALLCGAVCLLAVRLGAADRQFLWAKSYESAGRVPSALRSYREAVRLNPYEFHYRLNAARYLGVLASANAQPAVKSDLIKEAITLGREGARLRPALADGFALQGTYLLLYDPQSHMKEAAIALDEALARDPYLPALLENRLFVARTDGDSEAVKALEGRLQRVSALSAKR